MITAKYQKIDGRKYRKIFVVGDLHGCFSLLEKKMNEVGFDKEIDLMLSVGDLIDRGTQNIECLELIECDWFKPVLGNHELMAIHAIVNGENPSLWLMNGGGWFFGLDHDQHDYCKMLLKKAAQLPHIIELTDSDYTWVICHADYPDAAYEFGKPVDMHEVVWNRDRFNWGTTDVGYDISGADMFIFGHTPVKKWRDMWNQCYIDTGAVFNGNLTLFNIKGGAA